MSDRLPPAKNAEQSRVKAGAKAVRDDQAATVGCIRQAAADDQHMPRRIRPGRAAERKQPPRAPWELREW